jgi:hypothetical protein
MVSFKPIRTLVAENDIVRPLKGQLALISRLQKTLADTLPASLRPSSRVAAVEGTTLIIAATNGSAAALLKQMAPRLVETFCENKTQEQKVTAIRVIVQPVATAETSSPAGVKKPKSPISDQALADLSGNLSESPLKETLTKIQRRRERALTTKKRV